MILHTPMILSYLSALKLEESRVDEIKTAAADAALNGGNGRNYPRRIKS